MGKTRRTPKTPWRQQLRERHRVTGRELAERARARHEARVQAREARTDDERGRRQALIIGGVVGAIAVTTMVIAGGKSSALDDQIARTQTQIDQLNAALTDASATPQAAPTEVAATLTQLVQNATIAATRVRDAQQDFARLFYAANDHVGTDGAPSDEARATAAHRTALQPFFDPESLLVSDDDIASWQNVDPFDDLTQIDPRYPWFIYWDGDTAASPSSYEWSVTSVMPVLTEDGEQASTMQARVIWQCQLAQTKTVLAVVSAIFTASNETATSSPSPAMGATSTVRPPVPLNKAGVFSDVSLMVTPAGAAHQSPRMPSSTVTPRRTPTTPAPTTTPTPTARG